MFALLQGHVEAEQALRVEAVDPEGVIVEWLRNRTVPIQRLPREEEIVTHNLWLNHLQRVCLAQLVRLFLFY